jgi:hypothetical protein
VAVLRPQALLAVDLQVQLKQEQVVEREQVVAARQIPLP